MMSNFDLTNDIPPLCTAPFEVVERVLAAHPDDPRVEDWQLCWGINLDANAKQILEQSGRNIALILATSDELLLLHPQTETQVPVHAELPSIGSLDFFPLDPDEPPDLSREQIEKVLAHLDHLDTHGMETSARFFRSENNITPSTEQAWREKKDASIEQPPTEHTRGTISTVAPESLDVVDLGDTEIGAFLRFANIHKDKSRLNIASFMSRQDDMTITEFVELLNESQPMVSHHVALMHEAGYLERRREGKHNYYSLSKKYWSDYELFVTTFCSLAPGAVFETLTPLPDDE